MLRVQAGMTVAATIVLSAFSAARGENRVETVDAPVLVELFLSQSCKASPPAAEILADLSQRNDVVTLAWHVGYWNTFSGEAGKPWADPYSKPAFGERQRAYNQRIRGKDNPLTPQAIIDGEASVIASKREKLAAAIEAARDGAPGSVISISRNAGSLSVTVSGQPGEAFLATFLQKSVTEITGGDNAGLTFNEANVVTDFVRLGEIADQSAVFAAPAPRDGMGCAIIVQTAAQGRVMAARYCP